MTALAPEKTAPTTLRDERQHPPRRASLDLAAVLTAVSCSRLFVRHTLRAWNLSDQIDHAELIVSELVTNAVKATGVLTPEPTYTELENLNLLSVRVQASGDGICIQVWDAGVEPLKQTAAGADDDAESGRGLFIVAAVARRVGHFYPRGGGKVVWAELPLDPPVQPLPRRTAKKSTNIRLAEADPTLLRSVLEGLRNL